MSAEQTSHNFADILESSFAIDHLPSQENGDRKSSGNNGLSERKYKHIKRIKPRLIQTDHQKNSTPVEFKENYQNSEDEEKENSSCSGEDQQPLFNVSQNFGNKSKLKLGDQSSIWNAPAHQNDITQTDIANILDDLDRDEETDNKPEKETDLLTSFQRDINPQKLNERKTSSSGGSSYLVPSIKTQIENEVSQFFSKNILNEEKVLVSQPLKTKL